MKYTTLNAEDMAQKELTSICAEIQTALNCGLTELTVEMTIGVNRTLTDLRGFLEYYTAEGGEIKVVTYGGKGFKSGDNFYKVKASNDKEAIEKAKKMFVKDWYEGEDKGRKQLEKTEFRVTDTYAEGGQLDVYEVRSDFEEVNRLYAELTDIFNSHIENDGDVEYPYKDFGYIAEDLDRIDIGWFKTKPDGSRQVELKESGYSLSNDEAIELLETRIKNTKEAINICLRYKQ